MQFLIDAMAQLPAVKETVNAIRQNNVPAAIFALPDMARAVFCAYLKKEFKRPIFVLTENEAQATRLAEELQTFGLSAAVFPSRDYQMLPVVGASKEYEHRRISTLYKIKSGECDAVFFDIEAFTQKTISPDMLEKLTFGLETGSEADLTALKSKLVEMGYESTLQVDGVGQFAVRGGILDLFPPNSAYPVRVEFWGDEVDSISQFDKETQRRLDPLEKVTVLPAAECVLPTYDLKDRLTALKQNKRIKNKPFSENLERDIFAINSGLSIQADKYLLSDDNYSTYLFNYFKDEILLISEAGNVFNRFKSIEHSRTLELTDWLEAGTIYQKSAHFWADKTDVLSALSRMKTVYIDSFTGRSYPLSAKQTAGAFVKQLSCWGGSIDVLLDDLRPALKKGRTAVICAGSKKGAEILINQLEANQIHSQLALHDDIIAGAGVFVMPYSLSAGLEFSDSGLLVLAHKAAKLSNRRKIPKRNKSEIFHSLEELKTGDYVVHAAHGIGQFDGIHRIETGKVVKDYIKIKYRGSDVLYVPVTQLDMVSRYIGSRGENGPVLHRLGGTEWQKTKVRVKAAVKDMAKELIRLYGERMKVQGFAFSEDCEMQRDFEGRFPFDETDDQLKAISEIKADMQRAVPMDRLLCGDVGFGKTEVALRAAFKCMCDSKQCALLVPTTILAWQHYLTATERFGNFPVKVEMLSRFKTKSETTKILKALKRGEVDMVIGTHRIISNDVIFKDLGLVIIDEEQRFGVAQKEKLKTLFNNVDVLTLSATPIPRTLNMAMSGIRDMSSIEQAPQDRQPVQTYVMEQNNSVLLEAIKKELRRGGQVYYLHNRVESIMHCAARLSEQLPNAVVGVAHGKMGEEELSDVWRRLLEGEIDVLVCTTIIETGVDVPNANTLIIENADRMGLAQLHQIRGRVGRSSRRAYAYFCFQYGKALSEVATKRLEAIREYTEFGSGFKIAMRDLEIRGAGSILGGEQHGHMEAVGYDMYLELLEQAVNEEKGNTNSPIKSECSVDLNISANIPSDYMPSLSHRLEMYRRISEIQTLDDKSDVIDELCDRFGEPPAEVLGLTDIALLKGAAGRNGICEITGTKEEIRLYIQKINEPTAALLIKKLGNIASLVPAQRPYFRVKLAAGADQITVLKQISELL